MSKAVLLSIRPEWCKKILDGEKTVEVRRTCPVHGTPFKAYIYCTRTASKEFILDDDNWDKLTDLWEAREAAQRKGKKDGKYHDLVTDMLARAIHSVGIEYADEIAAYEEERRMRRSYYEKVENRANGLQEEEPDPLSPARAAIATAMQAAKVSEVTGAPLPKPLTWKRRFYDTTRTFPSGWYECPVCGCRADWEPEQCPKCYTRLEPEETEG